MRRGAAFLLLLVTVVVLLANVVAPYPYSMLITALTVIANRSEERRVMEECRSRANGSVPLARTGEAVL